MTAQKASHPYLAIILDLFTRSLHGWNLARTLSTELALTALERALAQRVPDIHHSDQGVQYAAPSRRGADQYGRCRPGHGERLRGADHSHHQRRGGVSADYIDFADAYHRIGNFIEDVYQTKRIHSALGYLTPAEFEAAYWARQGSLALPVVIGHPTACVEATPVSSGWS